MKRTLSAAVLMLVGMAAMADSLFVVRVRANSSVNSDFCEGVGWNDNMVFYNTTGTDAVVSLLGVSNGGPAAGQAVAVHIPPGQSVNSAGKININWDPAQETPIWVNQIDVPPGVVVKSRAEAHALNCGGIPPSLVPDFGAFSLPVFDHLESAGSRQIHLGADLGAQLSTLNVGVYNDAAVTASGTIEVRQVCDNALRETLTVVVPGKSLVQVNGVGETATACPSVGSEFNSWMRYVVVTLDQPGFSYVVNRNLAIPSPPVIPYASP